MSPATSSGREERVSMPPLPASMPSSFTLNTLAKFSAGTLPVNMPPYTRDPRPSVLIDGSLFELDPREVVDGVLIGDKTFFAPDPIFVGSMRETCPHCHNQQLQLVLRRHHVKRAHLFCTQCTRCYDVLGANGASFLDIA